jgi:hypothetical protein
VPFNSLAEDTSNAPFSPRGPGQPEGNGKFADMVILVVYNLVQMLSPVRYT